MNIVLIGMPGAGKSTLGVLLAKALGMDFVDTDLLIQQSEGLLLQQIIDRDGLARFMALEEAVICALSAGNAVIATGGSAVYSQKAMQALHRHGKIVYLHTALSEIERRVTNITSRGIVLPQGATMADIYAERLPLYQSRTDSTLDCTGKDTEQCVSELAALARAF